MSNDERSFIIVGKEKDLCNEPTTLVISHPTGNMLFKLCESLEKNHKEFFENSVLTPYEIYHWYQNRKKYFKEQQVQEVLNKLTSEEKDLLEGFYKR